VSFVDDWEGQHSVQETVVVNTPSESLSLDDMEPDWLVLKKQLQAKYTDNKRIVMEEKTKLPLRVRWCSAYLLQSFYMTSSDNRVSA
jgi:hypothetical protein